MAEQCVVVENVETLVSRFSAEVKTWQQVATLPASKLINSRHSSSPGADENSDIIADSKRGTVDVPTHPDNESEHGEGTSKEAKSRQTSISEQQAENGRNLSENSREYTLTMKNNRGRNPKHECAEHP